MTKVNILVEGSPETKKLKPIEFVKFCLESGRWESCTDGNHAKPCDWECIYLIAKNWRATRLDLMICSDSKDMHNGMLVLGHFNDGVVL